MAFVVEAVMEVLRQRTVGGVISGLALISAPLWAAVLVGLLVGWAWKPKWAASLVGGAQAGPSALSCFDFGYVKAQLPGFITSLVSNRSSRSGEKDPAVSPMSVESEGLAVAKEDLEHLWRLVEGTDGGPAWHQMMDKRLPSMSYRAWRRDPETGPPQYRSSTVFEDATPEIVRDFFWDDDFRMKSKWDDMLIHHATLEECPMTGTMFVHWIRKFPFFCSDREYMIGRRIWKFGTSYYCVTKGVPCLSVPRRNKPRRVDLYYSSWCIRPVESRKGDGQLTACEVLLFHHEDMGIPWQIAKLGVRQGMWGCVRKIEPGLRAYQMARSSNEPLSQSAKMAQVTTKVDSNYLKSLKINTNSSVTMDEAEDKKTWRRSIPKFLVVGGAVALGCSLDRGLLTKAIIFGVARRFIKQGRRLYLKEARISDQ